MIGEVLLSRRTALVGTTAILGGCLEETISGATGPNPDEVREEAETIPHDELMRNIQSFDGEAVYYEDVRITDIPEHTESRQEFIARLPTSTFADSHYLWCVWTGSRQYREDDTIEIWGLVEGLHTYMSIAGEQTVPKIDVIDIGLLE